MNAAELQAKGFVEVSPGNWKRQPVTVSENAVSLGVLSKPVERESKLHDHIIDFCFEQWPRWKVVFARTDKKSTLPVGCHDMTIFASERRVFCFELKAKGNKPDKDQQVWHKELEMLGHHVHTIYDYATFLEIVK